MGSGTKICRVEKGHRSSSNRIGSNHKGGRGPSDALAGEQVRGIRNSRREHRPRDRLHTVEAPTHGRANRTEEEGQGLEIGH